jgi:amino acid permease
VGIVLIPLVTVKTIERLRFVSLIAILSVATFTSILIYNFIKQLANGSLASGNPNPHTHRLGTVSG